MYQIGKIKVKRCGEDRLEFELEGNKTQVSTEDLAMIVREELPNDRAGELFAEMEEKFIQKGKARIVLKAEKDIKKGDPICAVIDINKFVGDTGGVRTTQSGIIF